MENPSNGSAVDCPEVYAAHRSKIGHGLSEFEQNCSLGSRRRLFGSLAKPYRRWDLRGGTSEAAPFSMALARYAAA